MNKVISVLLFIGGLWFIAAALMSCMVRSSAGLAPEIGLNLFMIVLGGLGIWGGTKFWKR